MIPVDSKEGMPTMGDFQMVVLEVVDFQAAVFQTDLQVVADYQAVVGFQVDLLVAVDYQAVADFQVVVFPGVLPEMVQ